MSFDRRKLVSALLAWALAAWPARAEAAPQPNPLIEWLRDLFGLPTRAARRAATRYITPDGAGSGDGSSWRDAGRLSQLPAFVREAGPGGRVLLAADRGRYDVREVIALTDGGAAGRPVRIEAVNAADGAEAVARIWGGRVDPFDPRGPKGAECFRLLRGADHLAFRRLHFRNIGNGCIRIGAPTEGLTVEDCTFRNVYRFIENTVSGGERDATLRNFAVRRCSGASIERSFARIRYASNSGIVEDCRADGEGDQGDPFAVGCALEDAAHAITFRRCVMENFRQNAGPGRYWNADGFSDESRNHGIRYELCEARGCTDGGFDCKSDNVVLDRCVAEGNKINFKIWSLRSTLLACTTRNPNWRGRPVENGFPAHFWFGGRPNLACRIRDLVVEDDALYAVFAFEGDGIRVQVVNYALACHDDAPIIAVAPENSGCSVTFLPETSAPTSRRAPAITGQAAIGETVRAQKGLWAAYPRPSYAYQWRRDGAPIPGATSQSYALSAGDRGAAISVAVTARNSAGAASAVSPALTVI